MSLVKDNDKILILGASGMVGSSILEEVKSLYKYNKIYTPTSSELNLLDSKSVSNYFFKVCPDYVFLCAAKVGGIVGNKDHPADYGYENSMISLNVIYNSYKNGVKKLLFLGSSCIYPKFANQPILESELLSGKLEKTNEMYALSKILGLKLCEAYREQYACNFISCMPCNLYGENDNFDEVNGHVIPSLISRFNNAKTEGKSEVVCWGDGSPKREFLYSKDLAKACIFLMENYNDKETINVGYGKDISIFELANLVKDIVGFKGKILWDNSKPNGTPRKIMDSSKIFNMGWKPKCNLYNGLQKTYKSFLEKKYRKCS